MTSLAHPFYHHWHTFCFQIYIPLWLNPLPLLWFFAYMFLLSVVSSEFACSLTLWTQANLNVSISSDLPFIHSAGSLPLRVFCLWFPLCEESASCLLRPLGETDTGLSFLPVLRSILLACLTTSIFFCWPPYNVSVGLYLSLERCWWNMSKWWPWQQLSTRLLLIFITLPLHLPQVSGWRGLNRAIFYLAPNNSFWSWKY